MATTPIQGAEGATPLIDKEDRYRPLGVLINKQNYRIPSRFKNAGEIIGYLQQMRTDIENGGDFMKAASGLYNDLGLSTANLESFQKQRHIWGEFRKTCNLIADKLLKSNGNSHGEPLDFRATGFERAADFLRPLAYEPIPDDPDHVWGYLTPGAVPAEQPPRCGWHYDNMDAERVLYELHEDLAESLRRRKDLRSSRPAENQCAAPQHPVRVRTAVAIEGADSLDENGEEIYYSDERADLEYGSNYNETRALPAEGKWSISNFTCEEAPELKTVGDHVVVRAPAVTRDCVAELTRQMTPSVGPVRSVTKKIDIYNTDNRPPTVGIRGPKWSSESDTVTLRAIGHDADHDELTYSWEQTGGPKVEIIKHDGGRISFRLAEPIDKDTNVQFRVTVTDRPKGSKAVLASAEATHTVTIRPTKLDAIRAAKTKRDAISELARASGRIPEQVSPYSSTNPKGLLLKKIAEASTPDEEVEGLDLVYVLDASGSMMDDVALLKEKVPEILADASKKVRGGIPNIRVAVVSYVDNRVIYHLDLTGLLEEDLKTAEGNNTDTLLQQKLYEVIQRITTKGGSLETIWDALYSTIEKQPWRKEDKVERRIVYITDESGDIGNDGRRPEDVERVRNINDVSVVPIFIINLSSDEALWKWSVESNSIIRSQLYRAKDYKDAMAIIKNNFVLMLQSALKNPDDPLSSGPVVACEIMQNFIRPLKDYARVTSSRELNSLFIRYVVPIMKAFIAAAERGSLRDEEFRTYFNSSLEIFTEYIEKKFVDPNAAKWLTDKYVNRGNDLMRMYYTAE